MKNLAKQKRFPELGILDFMKDVAETSGKWVNWQIIRGKRYVWWETDRDVLSRWAQSIIETEERLREITQHEIFIKDCIQKVGARSDEAAKIVVTDMIEDMISLDHEYSRLERIYDTMVAGCPVSPIKSGYLWIRKQPQWHLKSVVRDLLI
ncbi:hypothetical protein N7491_002560 [Penicillium cf. griseofulvum]|uniref:Uncharacterized protein n=1 Tax=Penicillium cf. griseofulvum TaxID=2972120 RepID=A0A9W9T2B4_9EURO|nr:hypothetical protein N7472_003255 [Penicillium cf. griseofulvum]KAJ5446478.1 hypothetical protein N7491_002560 [Penicillium cf. griseofulvum]KAJ5448219.1 hypothetical protein N7445_003040 [Penicillium cf. griseofulvum]